jgi:4-nitrophenyl phosphatase
MSVTYRKLAQAFQHLRRNPGCAFIATNGDSTYPTADGLLPGAGACFAPLATALGREPTVIGKPNKTMLDCIKAKCVPSPKTSLSGR